MPTLFEVVRSLWYGATLVCPNCRKGRIASTLLTTHDVCPRCGVGFEPGRGEFTGAMMLAWGLVGFVALFGYFVLYVLLRYPHEIGVAWAVFFAVAFPVLFYRNVKGFWIGILHAAGRLKPAGPGGRVG